MLWDTVVRTRLEATVTSRRQSNKNAQDSDTAGTRATSAEPTHTGATAAEPAQELLFEGDYSALPSDRGFRGPIACSVVGITYRQLDYWARTGLVAPEIRTATGSGSQRLYSFKDILILKVIKRLIDAGISLQQVRTAIDHLRARGVHDLTEVTLMSDGITVFECTSDDEVIDLLRGGQGVFGIALGGVWKDIEGTLAQLPIEPTAAQTQDPTEAILDAADDELSRRRRARAAG
jgi:DNA-binding transcriptional MerR regulator